MQLTCVLVPIPATSLSVSNVSTTGITLKWTIPSSDNYSDNYVTYYTISYTPSCSELSSVNETVSVAPHQSTTTYSYTLIGLYSGMNYTITVRAGNVLGGSGSISVKEKTIFLKGKYISIAINISSCFYSSYWCAQFSLTITTN